MNYTKERFRSKRKTHTQNKRTGSVPGNAASTQLTYELGGFPNVTGASVSMVTNEHHQKKL
jgi:hypothetical protein